MFKKFFSVICVIISLSMLSKLQFTNNMYYLAKFFSPKIIAANPKNIIIKSPEPCNFPNMSLHAFSACLMDASNKRVLFSKKSDIPLPMASTTKIMTCIIALESGRTHETAVVSPYAAGMPNVQLNALSGEQYIIKDLLYSLMLESHNDSAVIIAEHIGGSVEGFAEMMNEKAALLGCENTHFITPNGLDANEHYTTAKDLCIIAAYAIQNPDFIKIIQTKSYSFSDLSGKRHFNMYNHDLFLSMYKGAIGIKTGFTGKAGYCFVGAAGRDNATLVSCVLASGWPPNKSYKWNDTKSLMDFGFSHYKKYTFDSAINPITLNPITVTDSLAGYADLLLDYSYSVILSPSDTVMFKLFLPENVAAPVYENQKIGEASLFINDKKYAVFPVKTKNRVEQININDIIHIVFKMYISYCD